MSQAAVPSQAIEAGQLKAPRRTFKGLLAEIAEKKECYLLLLPTFALLILFNYYPAISAIFHSLFQWNGVNLSKFVGLRNFAKMLSDETVGLAFLNVLRVTIVMLVISVTFPLAGAELIYKLKNDRLAYAYRVLFVIPMVVPMIVTIMIWQFIYNPTRGLLNELVKAVGLPNLARPWLGDFDIALYAVLFVGFPWVSGFAMLIYLAGLQNIPVSIVESATIEGATAWFKFFKIEIPLILSQIKLIVILTIVGAVQGFVNFMILTNGGPGDTTMVPGLYLYRNAMYYNRMGYACAIGTTLFIIILSLTFINLKYMKSSTEYGGE